MGTLQTCAETLVFCWTLWVAQVATWASKLFSSFGALWQELDENFQNISSVMSIFWRQVCEFLRRWATEQLYGQTESFLKMKFRSFLRMLLIVKRDGALAAAYSVPNECLRDFWSVTARFSTVSLEYFTNSTTSGVESVRSFQPSFPGKYVWRNLFTIFGLRLRR